MDSGDFVKKHKAILIVFLILVLTVIYLLTSLKTYYKASKIDANKITEVVIKTDWGKNKVVTSQSEIRKIITDLNSVCYLKLRFLPAFTGYLYNVSLYEGNQKLVDSTIGMFSIINGNKYLAFGLNINKFETDVGLIPPS